MEKQEIQWLTENDVIVGFRKEEMLKSPIEGEGFKNESFQNFYEMIKPLLKGQSKEEINHILIHCEYRIVREDDKHYMITDDLKLNRINLEFDNNYLTKSYLG